MEDIYNLIYNGKMLHGMDGYRPSYNSRPFTCDTSDKPDGCGGSYVGDLTSLSMDIYGFFPMIPFIKTDTYNFQWKLKDNGSTASTIYMCIRFMDNKGANISVEETQTYQPSGSTITTLAYDLKNGDTTVHLTDASKWRADTNYRILGIMESAAYGNTRPLVYATIAKNGVDTTANTLTLSAAWNKGTYKAGTTVREFTSGATYYYPWNCAKANIPQTWTNYSRNMSASSDLRFPQAYFLSITGMYGNVKYADFKFINITKPQARVPIKITPTTYTVNEEINNVNSQGQVNTGLINEGFIPVRYIRDWCNGSTANTSNHWVEIQAYDRWDRNIAYAANGYDSTVTFANNTTTQGLNAANSTSYKTFHLITNNSTTAANYISKSAGSKSVTIDMGLIHYVNKIKVWHYWADGRKYHNTKTEVSVDGTDWITVFDSAIEGEYVESSSGHTITFEKMTPKFVKGGEIQVADIIEE